MLPVRCNWHRILLTSWRHFGCFLDFKKMGVACSTKGLNDKLINYFRHKFWREKRNFDAAMDMFCVIFGNVMHDVIEIISSYNFIWRALRVIYAARWLLINFIITGKLLHEWRFTVVPATCKINASNLKYPASYYSVLHITYFTFLLVKL